MKKTKKEKLLADLRRKMMALEAQTPKPVESKINNYREENRAVKSTYSFASQTSAEKFEIDYIGVKKDLRKAVLLSGLIFSSIIIVKVVFKF